MAVTLCESFSYKLICKRHIIVVFVDFLPNAGVFIHHRVNPCLLVKLSVGIDRLSDIDSVYLDRITVITERLGILHRYEYRNDRYVVFDRNTVRADLQGLRLTVIVPHTLLGIDKNEIAVL